MIEKVYYSLNKYLEKLLKGFVDCPELLYFIHFGIKKPQIRDDNMFYINFVNKNYLLNYPGNLLIVLW